MSSDDDICPVERDMLKRALKLSCITFAHDDQKRKYCGGETEERCPSSDIEVTHFVDVKVESSSSSSSLPVIESEYLSNVEEGMILRASRNIKESCKYDGNKRSGVEWNYITNTKWL
eukprot:scaffold50397_cov52-Attheya_sp.AAC.1